MLALRSVEFARNHDVPLHVRSSFTWEPGTWVTDGGRPTMEDPIISGVAHDISEAKVTMHRGARPARRLRRACSSRWPTPNVNVDMIVQNTSKDGTTDISFTVPKADMAVAEKIVSDVAADIGAGGVTHDADIAKVSLVGAGMKTSPGIAAKMFRDPGRRGRQHRDDLHVARSASRSWSARPTWSGPLRSLHTAFGLDSGQALRRAAARAEVTAGDPGFTRPWHAAGEKAATGDPVGEVGWVFNNELDQDPENFVNSGWIEVQSYFSEFGLFSDHDADRTVVEIGSGIGRMTAALTQRFGHVVACDVDASFRDRGAATRSRPSGCRTGSRPPTSRTARTCRCPTGPPTWCSRTSRCSTAAGPTRLARVRSCARAPAGDASR